MTGCRSIAVIRSPATTPPRSDRRNGRRPACAAELSGATSTIATPSGSPSARLNSGGAAEMPSDGRISRPSRISFGTMRFTSSTGIAKPMPALPPLGL